MTKVFVVHKHESCEGSTILTVTKSLIEAKKIVEKEQSKPAFLRCDECNIEEFELED